jgi:hypothetical protein
MAELFTRVDGEHGQRAGLMTRRVVVTLFAIVSLLALADVFGQQPSKSAAPGMTVEMPRTVRGGLLWQARVDIRAPREIQYPRLVLANGFLEGMQVNSIEPAGQSESSRDGRLVLSYGKLAAGDRMVVWMQFQVDPVNVGRRSAALELDDGTTPVARVERDITVLP